MEGVWITTVEVLVESGDMPSGDVLGFLNITMWASSEGELVGKINSYFSQYKWKLVLVEKA
jgi:hypothetical protein